MNPDSFCRTIVNDPNIILLISSAFLWSPNSIVQQTIAHQTHESTRKHRNQPQKKKNKSAQQAMFRKRQQSQKHVDDWRRHFVEQDSLAYRHQPYRRLDFVVHHSAIFDVHQNAPLGFWKLRERYYTLGMTTASTEQCGQFTWVQKDVLVHIPFPLQINLECKL